MKKSYMKMAAYAFYCVAFLLVSLELATRLKILKFDRFEPKTTPAAQATGERFNIVIAGDSFSVDQSAAPFPLYARLLAQGLAAKGVSTVNVSSPATGPTDYVSKVLDNIDSDTRFVILGYYVGNDLSDTVIATENKRSEKFRHKLRNWLNEYSALGRYLIQMRIIQAEKKWLRLVEEQKGTAKGFQVSERVRNRYVRNLLFEGSQFNLAWKRNRELITSLNDQLTEEGIKLLVAIFPATFQINDKQYAAHKKINFNMDRRMLSSKVPQEKFREFCTKSGINCLDLYPEFKKNSSINFYKPGDDHWNKAGNEFAYGIILKYLERTGWLN